MRENTSAVGALWERLTGGSAGTSSKFWVAGAAVALIAVGVKSCRSIEPGQVAVRINNVTGATETITQPGMILALPFGIHDVHVIDASPQTFHMRGETNVSDLEVRELTVRASDGSNFVFNDTTILYRVIGGRAGDVIRDSGQEHGYRSWMLPYSRSILRDEFGRESTISVSDPSHFGEATERARKRINELLNIHGIEITSIVTPRPRFTEEYENLIEARNQTENQLSVIESELARAATDRTRRMAEVDRDQNKIIQEKRAEHEAALATAVTEQVQTMRQVDTYKIEKVGAGQAVKSAAKQTAAELQLQLAADYSARKSEIEAFRNQPVERVMEKLGERLKGVTIEIQPYSDDSTPSWVQHQQLGGGQ
jgi:membrane protease subunit HflC